MSSADSSAEGPSDTVKHPTESHEIESAIEQLRNVDPDLRGNLADALFPNDPAGHLLAMALGGVWHEDSSGDALTQTIDSGSKSGSEPKTENMAATIGKYTILRKLGQGGMGTVYEAVDAFDVNAQSVALKTIHAGAFANESSRQRFVREMQTMASIQHANIVPILGSGAENGVPFFTMPLVDGADFAHRIRSNNSEVPSESELQLRARVVEQVCHALIHIHDAGYLHRDIKPANILLPSSDSQAMLSDFGIAKLLDDDSHLTRTDSVVGTINYAAPEQIWSPSDVDVRSDIYSLGITLYAALTGTRPYGEGNSTDIALRVKNINLPHVKSINSAVSDALATVCHRAMEKHPDDRYQTATEFARDLHLAINGRRPLLVPITRLKRIGLEIRRKPVRSSILAALGLIACFVIYGYSTRPAYLDFQVQPIAANVEIARGTLAFEKGAGRWQGPPGDHQVRVTADGYEPQDLRVNLRRGRGNVVTRSIQLVSLQGRIEFESIPNGAAVVVRDATGKVLSKGTTPYRSSQLPSGSVNVSVIAPLFNQHQSEQLVPKAGETIQLASIRLEPTFGSEMGSPLVAECLRELERPFQKSIDVNQTRLSDLPRHVAAITDAKIFIDNRSLAKSGISMDMPLDLKAASLNDIRISLQSSGLALVPLIDDQTPKHWNIVSYESSQSERIHGIFSLDALNPRLRTSQVIGLLLQSVNPAMWVKHGGPYGLGPFGEHRAISVIADIDTHLQVRDFIQKSSGFDKKNNADRDSVSDVWSNQIPLGVLHPVVEAFPLKIASKPVLLIGGEDFATANAFLDNDRLILGCTDSSLEMWETSSGKKVRTFEASDRPVRCIVGVPNHPDQFVVGDGRGEMARYEADKEQSLDRQWRHRGNLNCIAFTADEKYMFSSGVDGKIVRYTMPDFKHDKTGRMRDVVTSMVTLSRYEKGYIALNRTEHEQAWIFDQETLKSVASADCSDPIGFLLSLPETPTKRNFSIRGKRSMVPGTLIIGGTQLSTWAAPGLAAKEIAEILPMNVKAMATLPNENLIVTVHADGRVIFRDSTNLIPQAVLRMPERSGPYKLCVSPNGQKLAISRWDIEHDPWRAVTVVYDLMVDGD